MLYCVALIDGPRACPVMAAYLHREHEGGRTHVNTVVATVASKCRTVNTPCQMLSALRVTYAAEEL